MSGTAAAGRMRGAARLLLAGAALLAASRAQAQELQLTGWVEADHQAYFDGGERGRNLGRNQALVQLEARAGFGERARLFGAVELRGDQADGGRNRAYLDELYADLTFGRLDLRLGKQVVVWGKADGVNPTDHLAPMDYSDPLDTDDERIGVVAARPRLHLGGVQWEGVVAPVFQASTIPPAGSRWRVPLPARMPHPLDRTQTAELSYRFMPAAEPATTFRNVQYAARASGTVRGWDVSASWFDGWDDMPWMRKQPLMTGPASFRVEVTPEYLRKRAVGGDLATVVGPYTLRAEGAYVMPDPKAGPDHAQYVLGVERTFGDLMGAGGTMLLAQWVQELAPSGYTPEPFDLNHLFQRAVTGRVQHNLTASAQVVVDALYELEAEGYYVQPGASYRFGDHVRVETMVDWLGGDEDRFFGAFSHNRRFQLRARYSF